VSGFSVEFSVAMEDDAFRIIQVAARNGLTLPDLNSESDGLGDGQRSENVLLSQVAHERLRLDVLSGVLRPNQRLVEKELSELLGMSRTPVRDALVVLAVDGLVDRGKHGWTVHEYSREELVAIYEVRGALEGYAARLSALRATEEELDVIERTLDLERGELDLASPDSSVNLNIEFHSMVVGCCGNQRLIELAVRNAGFYFNFRVASMYTEDEYQRSIDDHLRLLAALQNHDGESAERTMREHISESLRILLTKGRW
jgi:DNA-binding GntR family transcriptional regulator